MSDQQAAWPDFNQKTKSIETLKDEEKEALETLDAAEAQGLGNGAVEKDSLQTRESERKGQSLWPGLILIAIGSYFLLLNFTDFRLDNWWALFILLPAFSSLEKARNEYRASGQMNKAVRSALGGALITGLVAAAFLFNLDWGLIWPLFLIIVALGALLGTWQDD